MPDRYKVSADPAPFRLLFESSTPVGQPFREWLRVTATDTSSIDAQAVALDEAVHAWVCQNPGLSQNAVVKGVQKNRDKVTAALARLFEGGRLDQIEGTRNAILWIPTVPGEQRKIS